MVAEANIESHGMGYGPESLAKDAQYKDAHLERNMRHIQRNFNHPSIIFWSMGNEAGFGQNFIACYKWLKAEDPSRPVQYEQAHGNQYTDITCPMYADYAKNEEYLASGKPQPLIQCEYAHAMGNSMGAFKEYWDLIRKYPNYQGGFIWDFADQSIRWQNAEGTTIFAYGGDFHPEDPSTNNFCNNGIVGPDRELNPHSAEVAYYYQEIWTTPVDLEKGEVSIYNEYFFKDLSNIYMEWEILVNGVVAQQGALNDVNVESQQSRTFTIPYESVECNAEVLLNVRYKLKKRDMLLPAGHVIAYDQLTIKDYVAKDVADLSKIKYAAPVVSEDGEYICIKSDKMTAKFNKADGYLSYYEVVGEQYINEGGALRPNFWRAGTDNDYGASTQNKYSAWKNPRLELTSLTKETVGNVVEIKAEYKFGSIGAKLVLNYKVAADGTIVVNQNMITEADAKVSNMYRFGMRMPMPSEYSTIEYYGRGPGENYSDRNNATKLGIYYQSVAEQYFPYIRPQETGAKSDIRWWNMMNDGRAGISITSTAPVYATALEYTIEMLDDGKDKDQRHAAEMEKAGYTDLCLDLIQYGLACRNSWNAVPLPAYQVPFQDYSFTFVITPLYTRRY